MEDSNKKILLSLYDLLQSSEDARVLRSIAEISWELGVTQSIDLGFHELSELAQSKIAGKTEGNEHYISVIKSHLPA